MTKKFLIFPSLLLIPFILLFLFNPYPGFAQDSQNNFDVNSDISFNVLSGNKAKVIQKISIINKKEFIYSPSYSISLGIKNIENINVNGASGAIPYTLTQGANNTKIIDINFPDKVVGLGKENNFVFSYTSSDFTQLSGSVLTVTVPSLAGSQDFNNYTVTITVPPGYSDPTIVKPDVSYDKKGNTYTFSQISLLKNGAELIFGGPQVYQFELTYHLQNNDVFPIKTEVALPPDTSYQDVLLENISPRPENTYLDTDGNIMASFVIPSKTTINAKAIVLVKTYATPLKKYDLTNQQKSLYLSPQKYWEVNDPEIKKLAGSFKTPDKVFDYVVKSLSYDTKKADSDNSRLGAKEALAKPFYAVCLEFTDLFVALSRAAGIPARAVEGYAYTNGSSNKPLSLFSDVLHSWPEYYDPNKKTWVMVDPTWENTTEGIDYFNSFDFDHVAFAINGAQSTYPIPAGGYKTNNDSKDISVSFPDSSVFVKLKKVSVKGSFSSFANGGSLQGHITLENNGNYVLSEFPVKIFLDGANDLSVTFPETPPYGSTTVSVSVPLPKKSGLFSLTNLAHKVTIQDENGKTLWQNTVRIFPFSQYYIIGGAILLGTAFVLIITFKTRGIPV